MNDTKVRTYLNELEPIEAGQVLYILETQMGTEGQAMFARRLADYMEDNEGNPQKIMEMFRGRKVLKTDPTRIDAVKDKFERAMRGESGGRRKTRKSKKSRKSRTRKA